MAATAPPGAGPSVDFSSHRPQKVMEKGRRALQRGFGALSLCRMKRWISDRRLHQPPLPGKGHGSSGDQMSQSAARAGSSLLPVRLCAGCGSPGVHVPRTLWRMPGPWGAESGKPPPRKRSAGRSGGSGGIGRDFGSAGKAPGKGLPGWRILWGISQRSLTRAAFQDAPIPPESSTGSGMCRGGGCRYPGCCGPGPASERGPSPRICGRPAKNSGCWKSRS